MENFDTRDAACRFNDDVLGSELEAQRKEKLPGNHFGRIGEASWPLER
ncbi:MAG: hypothetical protein RL015_750 [Verrucomicrobiota bacterium]|jgi:hypothetical protein